VNLRREPTADLRPLVDRAWQARALLPADRRAPTAARRLVSTMLLVWGYRDQVELVELVVSELVSNAVRYAGDAGDIEVELSADADLIHLTVADGSPNRPVVHVSPEDPRSGGLGLQLLSRVARRWGVTDYLLGKQVWVDIAVESADDWGSPVPD